MRRPSIVSAVALALIALAGTVVFTATDARERPLAVPLEALPIIAGAWTAGGTPPREAFTPDPRATDELMRVYRRGGDVIWASVAYYPYQGEGRRAAARELLIPGHSWSVRDERRLTIPTPGAGQGSIDATQMILASESWRLAVVYWYQLPGRTASSEHQYRGLLLYNRLVHQRADAALVRIATPLDASQELGPALSAELDFVQAFYGSLVALLQRSRDDRGGRT
jgi:EpsI family protein